MQEDALEGGRGAAGEGGVGIVGGLEILEQEPERLERLWQISDYMRTGFKEAGLNVWTSRRPPLP